MYKHKDVRHITLHINIFSILNAQYTQYKYKSKQAQKYATVKDFESIGLLAYFPRKLNLEFFLSPISVYQGGTLFGPFCAPRFRFLSLSLSLSPPLSLSLFLSLSPSVYVGEKCVKTRTVNAALHIGYLRCVYIRE